FLPSDAAATGHWVVVADGERARVFESHRHAPGLRPVLPYDLMVNQLRDGERWSDRAGNVKERANNVMHSMAAPTDPKEHESDLPAKPVADGLGQGPRGQRVEAIGVVAAPPFLGRPPQAVETPARSVVGGGGARHLVRLPGDELGE